MLSILLIETKYYSVYRNGKQGMKLAPFAEMCGGDTKRSEKGWEGPTLLTLIIE